MRTLILILLSVFADAQSAYDRNIFDDKFKHNAASIIIAVSVGEIIYQTTDLEGLSSAIGGGLAIAITVGKEYIYDRELGYGVFSVGDIIAGCMGAITGAMIHRVIIDLRYKHRQKEFIKLTNQKRLLD
jgi:hypothetical protein